MKTFGRLSFRLAPHSLFVFLISLSPLLLVSPSVVLAQWEPDVRLTFNDSSSVTSASNSRSIAAGPGNLVHVVWQDTRAGRWEIYYKCSSDAGVTWSQDIRLTQSQGFSYTPSVTVLDSIVHVVWTYYSSSEPYEIYYMRSSDGGLTWSSMMRLTNNIYGSFEPSVAAFGSNVYLVWRDARDSGNNEIYYKRSSDQGRTWDSMDTRLTYATSTSWCPAVEASGFFVHVVWWDSRTGRWEVYYKRSSDGGVSWGADTCFTNDAFDSYRATLAVSDSVVHVVWQDARVGDSKLYYKRSTDSGNTWSADNRLTIPYAAVAPSLISPGSMVHLVWHDLRDGNLGEIYYKRSSDNGTTWSSDVRLTFNPDSSHSPSAAVAGPIVHVVWYDRRDGNREIYYKRNLTGSGTYEWRGSDLTIPDWKFNPIPNPFTFFATLPGHEAERFALYDISGRKIGIYKGDRIGEGLSAGVYFLRPEGKDAKPLRVVKVR